MKRFKIEYENSSGIKGVVAVRAKDKETAEEIFQNNHSGCKIISMKET